MLGSLAVTAEGSAVHLTPLTFDVVLGLVVCKPEGTLFAVAKC